MRGVPSILSLFRDMFNKLKNTGARMLDSFYHMTLMLHLWLEHFKISISKKTQFEFSI